jgi:hypothetical protein
MNSRVDVEGIALKIAALPHWLFLGRLCMFTVQKKTSGRANAGRSASIW